MFDVVTAVVLKGQVSWDVALCLGLRYSEDALGTFETSTATGPTIQCNIPEDLNIRCVAC